MSAGVVHPRDVDAHFAHGKVKNWFGGSSNATTQLLDGMHYRGLVRIAGRAGGVRLYADSPPYEPVPDPDDAIDALLDVVVGVYAPLPEPSLGRLLSHLGLGAPQWVSLRRGALARAKQRLASARVDGVNWYWPPTESPGPRRHAPRDEVRLLAPFDPIVWDRQRFEILWGWAYRFEAYTPAAKRVRGYYALPLLWRDQVVGWANVSVKGESFAVELGYEAGRPPEEAAFATALDSELERMRAFLAV